MNADPFNYSAHRLLADNYLAQPRHEVARDSELLQSQLLQPINVNPVQPRLAANGLTFLNDSGISAVGFSEYTRLFTDNRLRLIAEGIVGSGETATSNVILSGMYDRLSFSVGQFHTENDGVRDNNDIRQDIFNAFVQADVSSSLNVMVELRTTDQDTGDRPLLFDAANYSPELRTTFDREAIRIGFRQRFSPKAALIGTYARERFDDSVRDSFGFGLPYSIVEDGRTDFLELRYLQGGRRGNFTAGLGHANTRVNTQFTVEDVVNLAANESWHFNGYLLATLNAPAGITITSGLGVDAVREGNRTPERHTQASPKLGVTWTVRSGTIVRGAVFRTLKRLFIAGQTIEPTNIAGFDQFFDDANGTKSWRYGVGVGQRVSRRVFAGAELTYRMNSSPLTDPMNQVTYEDYQEGSVRTYVYATIGNRLATSIEWHRDRFESPAGANPGFVINSLTYKTPIEVRFFDPTGVFARIRAAWVKQRGSFLTGDLSEFDGRDAFWITDAEIGLRLPKQWGTTSLEFHNLFDQKFRFQDADPENPRILPGRRMAMRLTVSF